MEINNKEKIKNVDFDEIISKFHKIKDTVTNLKQVNNILFIYFNIQTNDLLLLSFNNKSGEHLYNPYKRNILLKNSVLSNKSHNKLNSTPIDIFKNNSANQRNNKKKIKFSKTQLDLGNNFSYLNSVKNNYINKNSFLETKMHSRKNNDLSINDISEINSARSFKLNYTDLNKYMEQIHSINNSTVAINKLNKISLNKYSNLYNINNDNSNFNNNSIKSLYYHKNYSNNDKMCNISNININKKNRNKFNTYVNKKIKNRLTYDSNYLYREIGKIVDNNNINNNINKSKKEKELVNLKNILNELKTKNNKIKKDLSLIKKQNLQLENNKNNINKITYINIKNILNNNDNKNKNKNNKNDGNILNIIKAKKYKSLSIKEKNNLLRNIYIYEKLKNSLIDKTCLLFLNINDKNKDETNGADKSTETEVDQNLWSIYKWISSIADNIEKLKKDNKKINMNINNLNKDKEIFKKYYNNWLNMLGINEKEELINQIDFLINYKNINSNEEAKMFKMLLNKKE